MLAQQVENLAGHHRRKRAIRPPSSRAHLLCVPGWQTSESAGTMPAAMAPSSWTSSPRITSASSGSTKDTPGNDRRAALFRPDQFLPRVPRGRPGRARRAPRPSRGSIRPCRQAAAAGRQASRESRQRPAEPALGTDMMPLSSSNSSTHLPRGIDQIGAPVRRSPIGRDETFCPVHASPKNLGNATRLHGFLSADGLSGRSCV